MVGTFLISASWIRVGYAHKHKTAQRAMKVVRTQIQQLLGWLCCRTSPETVSSVFSVRTSCITTFDRPFATDNGSSPRPLAEPSLAVTPHTPSINDPSVLAIPTPLQTSQASPHIPPLPAFSMPGRLSEGGSSLSNSTQLTDLGQLPPGTLAPDTRKFCSIFQIV
jgi:hypothetical protein